MSSARRSGSATKAFSVGDRVHLREEPAGRRSGRRTGPGGSVRLQIRNGTFGTVVGVIDPAGNAPTREGDVPRAQGDVAGPEETKVPGRGEPRALVVELDDGRRAVLPRSYVETSTSLGYALTVFRSQGITVDHTFGLGGDSLFQEAGYTQLSRGRLSNNLYVAAPENPRWEIGHHADDTAQRDALQSLVDALSQSREQTMAQDRLPSWPAPHPTTSPPPTASTPPWPDGSATKRRPTSPTSSPPPPTGPTTPASPAGTPTAPRPTCQPSSPRNAVATSGSRRHRDEITTWSRLDRDVRRYEYRLGQAASYTQPEHVTALLGPLPERIGHVERWQTRGRSHRGVSHPMEHHRLSHPRPRTGRSRTTCPLGQDRCHRWRSRVSRQRWTQR